MRSGAVSQSIRFRTDPALQIKQGQVVNLKVIKHLIGNKWAVSLGGRVFPATSSVALRPGVSLRAHADVSGRQVVLHLAQGTSSDSAASAAEQNIDYLATVALLREGRGPDPSLIRLIASLIRKLKTPAGKTARLMAILADKGFDIEAAEADGLLKLLMREEDPDGQEEGRNPGEKDQPPDEEELKELLTRQDDGSSLSLFNGISGSGDHWVIIPVHYGGVVGSLRLLLRRDQGLRRLVLDVSTGTAAGKRWAFVLEGDRLKVLGDTSQPSRFLAREFAALRRKLQNRGVKSDDSISEIAGFDGFSHHPEQESLGVDTFR